MYPQRFHFGRPAGVRRAAPPPFLNLSACEGFPSCPPPPPPPPPGDWSLAGVIVSVSRARSRPCQVRRGVYRFLGFLPEFLYLKAPGHVRDALSRGGRRVVPVSIQIDRNRRVNY